MTQNIQHAITLIKPGKRASARALGEIADTDAEPSAGVIRVLCVDDHAVLIAGLVAQFAIDGRIVVVGRLATAARLVEEASRLSPNVVLLDIEMPGPDAFEMANRLHQTFPEIRVIVLSAHIRDGYISAAFTAGASAYFAKSDEIEDILAGIHRVVRSKQSSFVLGPRVSERCKPVGTRGQPAAGEAPSTLLGSLTSREADILRLIGKGLSRGQIATQLCRSAKTIDAHQARMMRKLGIPSRADLMRFAIREGMAQA